MEDYKLIFSWVAFYKIHLPFTFLIRIMLWTKDKLSPLGTSLAVWWLRLCTSNAGGMGSIPGWGTKIPYAVWHDQKKKKNLSLFVSSWDRLPLKTLLTLYHSNETYWENIWSAYLQVIRFFWWENCQKMSENDCTPLPPNSKISFNWFNCD